MQFARFEGRVWRFNVDTPLDLDVLDKGSWRPALTAEVDLFSLLERGILISEEEALTESENQESQGEGAENPNTSSAQHSPRKKLMALIDPRTATTEDYEDVLKKLKTAVFGKPHPKKP